MDTTRSAFKEWAAVCRALDAGNQIVILRKGGIAEMDGEFQPDRTDFVLLPTYLHQAASGLKPDAEHWWHQSEALRPAHGRMVVRSYATVARAIRVTSPSSLRAIRGDHIWSDQVVAERFHRGRDHAVHVLLVRVYRLPEDVVLTEFPDYRGCKSWVDLEEPIAIRPATPVVGDAEFARRCNRILDALATA